MMCESDHDMYSAWEKKVKDYRQSATANIRSFVLESKVGTWKHWRKRKLPEWSQRLWEAQERAWIACHPNYHHLDRMRTCDLALLDRLLRYLAMH